MNSITDVGGIRVGHHQRLDPDASLGAGWACGVTVVLTPPGTVGAVDCRGGAPGTRETDLLDPANTVRYVDAVLLAGGSAYGLAAADGIMRWLEEHERGVAMDGGVVPIVPGAVIFDLPVGGWGCRPTAEFGYAACVTAASADGVPDVAVGTVGAGVGARAGVLKGGVGTASTTLPSGVTVGAIVVVNSAGEVVDRATGLPWMADLIEEFALTPPPAEQIDALARLPLSAGAAEHHDRGGCDRRRAECGGVPARRDRRPRRPGPQPSGPRTPRWTATRCSHWPPARSRCHRRPTRPPRCRRRRG